MRSRPTFWILLSLLLLAGAWFFWPHGGRRTAEQNFAARQKTFTAPSFTTTKSGSSAPQLFGGKNSTNAVLTAAKTNQFPYRLSNTKKTIGELVNDRRAILLENALIDTGAKLNLTIPKNLQAQGDPGAYIVQARGPIDAAFRAQLAAAGAQIVSYIPNDAYLVRISAGGANELAAQSLTESVIPYEPYYKLTSSLLDAIAKNEPVIELKVAAYPDTADEAQIILEKAGMTIMAKDPSPFGTVFTVENVSDVAAVARMSVVQLVEPVRQRVHANDLSRQTTGVSVDSVTTTNYLNLSGSNVLVVVNDSGIDATHPDLMGRVFGSPTNDTDGHGTFVAGQIAGDGTESTTVTNAQGSINPGTNFQYRGKAPTATLLSVNLTNSDEALQAAAALTNALISNNSWNFDGDNAYDLEAASYDAAVRDALPRVTGSQPVLFVFSAGNSGGGTDNGDGGVADTILSPGTAKNVITVGALEQARNITNIVTDAKGNSNAVWQAATDNGNQVAGYSSRGNVGIGTEGTFGRFKPDVVAPGSFVVSTRSQQWDEQAYYNPTNFYSEGFDDQFVNANSFNRYSLSLNFVPPDTTFNSNIVAVSIQIVTNANSPVPFPILPIYVSHINYPDPNTPSSYDFVKTDYQVSIPPDGGGSYLAQIQNGNLFYVIANTNSERVGFDIVEEITTTNQAGNYFTVLSNLNDSIGTSPYYYRYESGTSMSAADASGVLALMQDFFTNTLHATPSPALLKAMLINGARPAGSYNLNTTAAMNFEGWGLINLPDSLPDGITNQPNVLCSSLFLDQSPTNALATGDSQTFLVTINPDPDAFAQAFPLQVTLAWTDPPGNPAAAIKLVNNLDLVITNLDDPTNPIVYFGNDIAADSTFNAPWDTNTAPNLDSINNVENIIIPPLLGGSYSVTVIGRAVNVNAVTAQTTNSVGNFAPNAVQDYALVISCGEGEVPDAITVTANPIVSNPTSDQQITFVTSTNTPLFNQFAGGNTPLLGTNTVQIGGTNELVTLGMTNQWHFYVVTNTTGFTNVAFITFLPDTLAIPRMGAFADSAADATQPEADIDLYVTTDPTLTNLNSIVISNCVNGTPIGASLAGIFNGASLTRGGVEMVADTNSTPGQVYYVGVKSEDQEAAEYAFIPVFSETPFSQTDANGNEYVQGVPLPVNIPDGSPAHPGSGYVFALALQPVEVGNVVVTNTIVHQNFGDLIGVLTFNGISDVLNNHDSLGNPPGPYQLIYDDSGVTAGSQPSDGPGSLKSFQGQQGIGAWILTEVDDSLTQTGSETGFNMFIEKHQNPAKGINVSIAPGTWFYTFVDVAAGFTNLTVGATNTAPPISTPPLQLYLNFGAQPDLVNYLETASLTNGNPEGNSISYGPPLPPGRYYIGIFNPSLTTTVNAFVIATLSGTVAGNVPVDFSSTNVTSLLDDAESSSTIFVATTQQIASVNVGVVVNHPRISDLTFTLVSPTGQRILLMENRGGSTTNGAGDTFITTNTFAPVTANGGGLPQTNFLNIGETSGTLTINYDMFTIPDQMTVYYGTNSGNFTTNLPNPFLLFNTGFVSGSATINVPFTGTSTYVTIIMNQFGNPAGANGTAWTYTAGGVQTNFNYLTFTEDTNLTTIPIKFAVPPFVLNDEGTNYTLSDFELATNGTYLASTNIFDAFGGWNLTNQMLVGTNLVNVTNNEVSVVTEPAIAEGGSNFLALADGTIFRQIPMTVGRQFSLSYQYRGPGISAWYRGEGNATDSSDPENLGNNGWLIGRFNFPAGEVGQSFEMEDAGNEFQFAGTNSYVQIRQVPFLKQIPGANETNASITVQTSALDVGAGSGFTIEGWISPTNVSFQQPLVEWLAGVPTNTASVSNVVIEAGPFLDRATGHYYYMLGSTDWITSEFWATQLGGHLVTIDTANEQNWVFDTFAQYGGTNRNLWIGLTNIPTTTNFVWSSGLTNTTYFNWLAGEPTNCSGADFYTVMLGGTNVESGLWLLADNTGHTCNLPPTNHNYGVVEVNDIQTNGVQFWISVTNIPGTTNSLVSSNGCLYANLVDVTNGSHFIFSAPGLIQSNVFQHVALTYDTNSGVANLYYEGTNVASTNLGYFIPKTTGDVLLGKDMSRLTNNFYGGTMDEMSIYGRALSASEIAAIYQISASTTNRNIGKFDPAITPGLSLAEAQVSLGGLTNVILGMNDSWQSQSFSFTATTNSLPMQITGLEPGMLLDTFSVSEAPLGNLYYLPEQTLDSLENTSAFGTWTLEILDNRTGAFITNGNQLVSWQLQFVLATNTPPPVALSPQDPSGITVPPGQTVYLTVAVPSWATFATNIIVSSDLPVDLLFNPTNPPTGSNPGDFTLVSNSTGGISGIGSPVLSAASNPPLPTNSYYLGVRNNGAHAASVVVEVDFDITTLTNDIPLTSTLNTNDQERYFSFTVSSNATEATFQLLKLSGNADLVVSKGAPLPTLVSADYGSFNVANADENIYVLTNSSPVPLSSGLWYLGVFKRDTGPVSYTVLAKELDTTSPPTIITLTNGVPFNFTAGPGAALTNFFSFTVTNSPASIQFELYNLTGNGDLTVQTNGLPLSPPFFQTSQQPGLNPELVFIQTNSSLSSLTNSALTNLNAQWFLGVPNNETTNINYTILALINTNLVFPAFPGAEGAGAGALGGGGPVTGSGHGTNSAVYHVVNLNDSGFGSLRDAVSSTNRTIVFDLSGTINLSSPLIITNSYLTIAGQTAPGGGITVAGNMTTVQSAHDVIIRDVRFRPPEVAWSNGFEGYAQGTPMAGSYFSGGWYINSGNVDVLTAGFNGSTAYEGTNFIDIDGSGANPQGTISTNVATVPGRSYTLSFAYSRNPEGSTPPTVQLLQNGNVLLNLTVTTNNLWANLGWATTSVVFTATSASTQIQFASQTAGTYGVLLDAVSLVANVNLDDPLQFTNVMDVIADHVSASWSSNNLVSVLNSSNVTVQWSILSDSLYYTNNPHGYGSRLRYGGGSLSFNHNLYADNYNGSPRLGDNISLDFVNNVIYNWGTNSGFSSTNDDAAVNINGFTNQLNYVCNYLIAGPDTSLFATNLAITNIAFVGGTTNTWIFQTNNFIDSDTNGILNGANTQWGMFTNQYTKFGRPFPLVPVPTDEAFLAYEKVLDFAGPDMALRDSVDTNIVGKVRNQSGRLISMAGTPSVLVSTQPYLDTDRDGIPDFWETTFGQNPTNASANLLSTNASYIGYTDLEEYLAWLAGPHALTVTNTPVGVDLQQLCGKTGNLSFFVTNGVNGFVYLTNVLGSVTNTGAYSNSIAVFTPTNTSPVFSGYAAFDVWVTNNDTVAYFGPVTVSVLVSAVPVVYAAINTNSPPMLSTNFISSTNINELTLLTVTNTATDTNASVTLNYTVTMSIDTNAMNLLGWTNSFANTTNTAPAISTNGIITWTPSEAQGPGVYIITTVVSDNGIPPASATNSFSVTVNEVNLPPVFVGTPPNQIIPISSTLIVTNAATDSDIPPNPLTYSFLSAPAGATVDTNGVITWTPTVPGVYNFTNVVTDTNAFAVNSKSLSATNSFTVTVFFVTTPFAFTQPAQLVTGTTAQLNGMATPNGLPATAWFRWGITTNYGTLTPPVSVGTSFNVVYTNNQISGLIPNVPYHFQLVVSNSLGVAYGFDQILDEANVVAWGANYAGQITVPSGLSNVVAIAAAYDHSLALKNNGTAAGWGDNTFNQAGVPGSLNSGLLAVAGGQSYGLALKNSGTVVAWGANIFPNETNVPAAASNNVVTIASGQYSSLALKNNGIIVAWGANVSGLTNVPASLSNSAVAIAGGSFHNLAIKNDGTVVAWGDDSDNQTNVPIGLTNVVAISGGSFHSLALKKDGTVVAWGDDSAGQADVPIGLSNVVAIAAGGFHSLALKNDGSIVAWGDNSAEQISVPVGLTNFVAIAAGNLHSLALTPQSIASLTNIVLNLTNDVPQTNNITPGGITYYRVNVPTNADFATNLLLFTDAPLNVWFTTNTPPSIAANASLLLAGVTNGSSVLSIGSAPTNITPGAVYYLGVQNTNAVTVDYGIEVDFHLLTPPPVSISSIVYTNISGTNGFLLTWFAPSNDLFLVQWTPSLAPTIWSTFTNIVSYNTNFPAGPTNAQFNFFDDGSQTSGFGSMRFYRLILLSATNSLTLPLQTNLTVSAPTPVTVTNTAVDSRINAVLTYSLTNSPANASISTNGIITWTNATPPGLAARFNTIVTDDSVPPLIATNTFTIFVAPLPSITNVTVTATNVVLQWSAPTNDQFQVQWTTNLVPVINWTLFPNIITSTNGLFIFTDTNAPLLMKFYQLILLP